MMVERVSRLYQRAQSGEAVGKYSTIVLSAPLTPVRRLPRDRWLARRPVQLRLRKSKTYVLLLNRLSLGPSLR